MVGVEQPDVETIAGDQTLGEVEALIASWELSCRDTSMRALMGQQRDNIASVFGAQARVMTVVGFKLESILEAFPVGLFVYNENFDTTNTSKSLLKGIKEIDMPPRDVATTPHGAAPSHPTVSAGAAVSSTCQRKLAWPGVACSSLQVDTINSSPIKISPCMICGSFKVDSCDRK